MFYFKIVTVYTMSISILARSRSGNLLIKKKQENKDPENGYKFRNGNDLFLLSACNTQRFSYANQTALERQFVSAPGHSYYNCNTTKTSVALPIRA